MPYKELKSFVNYHKTSSSYCHIQARGDSDEGQKLPSKQLLHTIYMNVTFRGIIIG